MHKVIFLYDIDPWRGDMGKTINAQIEEFMHPSIKIIGIYPTIRVRSNPNGSPKSEDGVMIHYEIG
jgi:hypothetical protein